MLNWAKIFLALLIIGAIVTVCVVPIRYTNLESEIYVNDSLSVSVEETLDLDSLVKALSENGYVAEYFLDENGEMVSDKKLYMNTKKKSYTAINVKPIIYSIQYIITDSNLSIEKLNVSLPIEYTVEDEIALPIISLDGYYFDGYYIEDQKITSISLGSTLNKEITIKIEPIKYSIKYDYHGIVSENIPENLLPLSYNVYSTISFENVSITGYKYLGAKDEFGENELAISIGSFGNREISLYFEPIVYELSYVDVGVTNKSLLNYDASKLATNYTIEELVSFPTLSAVGYKFNGYSNESLSNFVLPQGNFGNKTIVINWEPIVYSISYVTNPTGYTYLNFDSKNLPSTYTIETGATLGEIAFVGYEYNGCEGLNVENGLISIGKTGNTIVTLNWTPIVYSISYVTNPSSYKNLNYSADSLPSTYTIESGAKFIGISYDGYKFNGLSGTNVDNGEISKGKIGNVEITLNWTPIVYSISYENSGINSNYAKKQFLKESYTREDKVSFNAITNDGYNFDGYYLSGNKITALEDAAFGDKVITLKWSVISYSISYVTNPSNYKNLNYSAEGLPKIYTIETGAKFTGVSYDGYKFNGCTGTIVENDEISKGKFGDIEVTLNWTPIVYSISYENSGINSDYAKKQFLKESYTREDKVTFDAITNDGYNFDGYYLSGNKITALEDAAFGDKVITLKWSVITYSISYVNNPNTYSHLSFSTSALPKTYTIESGAKFTGISYDGYKFKGCTGKNVESNAIAKGKIGDVEVTLSWELIPYAIEYVNTGIKEEYKEDQSSNLTCTYTREDNVSFNTLSNKGYDFLGYYLNNNKITALEDASYGNKNIELRWTPHVYSITYSNQTGYNYLVYDVSVLEKTTYTIENGVDLSTNTTPAATGFNFINYTDKDSTNYVVSNKIAKGKYGNVNVQLNWEPVVYSITFVDTSYGNKATNNNVKTYTIENTITLSPSVLANYQFVNWLNSESAAVNSIPANTTGNITLTASWTMVGEGTSSNPYLVYNEDQLKNLLIDNSAYYILQNDITISYTWTPIGTYTNMFTGNFDGNGKTLTLSSIAGGLDYFAIFGYLGTNGIIKNLNVASTGSWANSYECNHFAGICYLNEAGTIKNCKNKVNITVVNACTGNSISNLYGLAGICYYNYSLIENCSNIGALKVLGSESCVVGGVVVVNSGANAIIKDCTSTDQLYAEANSLAYVGRFAVQISGGGVLKVQTSSLTANVANYQKSIGMTTKVNTSSLTPTAIAAPVVYYANVNTSLAPNLPSDGYSYFCMIQYSGTTDSILVGWFSYNSGNTNFYGLNNSGANVSFVSGNNYGRTFLTYNKLYDSDWNGIVA